MGISLAGFKHELLVERDSHACETLAFNKARGVKYVSDWNVAPHDVRTVDWRVYADIDLVAGGPPCQPFSVGGKAAGNDDERDMWAEAIRAVRDAMPRAFVFENVRGLLRPRFAEYVRWIIAYLSNPGIVPKKGESHSEHLKRILRRPSDFSYVVKCIPVNAADYGAPQRRNRVLFVGFRRDIVSTFPPFPAPTHSEERLVWDKWVSAEYWRSRGLQSPAAISHREARIAERLRRQLFAPQQQAWLTCRDAFEGLGDPGAHIGLTNHKFQPGARSYPGHTGSPLDEPAKALKAGVHGVPGGENMIVSATGDVRYFTVREAARLQGLPDEYAFPGSWTESMRQIGNAVPVQLSRFVSTWVASRLQERKEGRAKRSEAKNARPEMASA